MKVQLEAITQTIAQEMETTGTIMLDGQAMMKNSSNPSPYAGLCRPAVDKLAGLVKDTNPQSRVVRVSFTKVGDTIWERSRHVIAEVETQEGTFRVDPTIRQYVPNAQMVYVEGEEYPIEYYPDSVTRTIIYDGL